VIIIVVIVILYLMGCGVAGSLALALLKPEANDGWGHVLVLLGRLGVIFCLFFFGFLIWFFSHGCSGEEEKNVAEPGYLETPVTNTAPVQQEAKSPPVDTAEWRNTWKLISKKVKPYTGKYGSLDELDIVVSSQNMSDENIMGIADTIWRDESVDGLSLGSWVKGTDRLVLIAVILERQGESYQFPVNSDGTADVSQVDGTTKKIISRSDNGYGWEWMNTDGAASVAK